MLKLILGGSGSGKTFTVMERIGELTVNEPESAPILLVPEQFSYETERLLLKRLPPKEAGRVKVYSFTRFSELVLRECGVTPQKPLDDATRLLLLDEAFYTAQERLRLLKYREGNVAQLSTLSDAIKELKQNAVTHELLETAAESLPSDREQLKQKLRDLDVLQEAFSALVRTQFDDPQDLLTQAKEALLSHPALYGGVHVFLDGFTGFTVQEEQLLSCLLFRAATVTAALCCDDYAEAEEEALDLFLLPKQTAGRLVRLAREAGVPVAAPFTRLTEDYRHKNEPLKALCAGLFSSYGEAYETTTATEKKAVTVFSCADKDEECRAAAREIRFFLRNGIPDETGESQPGRCRDVAIVTRSLGEYSGALEMALQSEGIPYYVDARESIRNDALIETICAALRVVRFSFRTEDVLRLLKTGFTAMTTEQIAALENYAYQWSIQGDTWKTTFAFDPAGLRAAENEEDKARAAEQLALLNEWRQAVVAPLLHLKERLSGNVSGETFARAVFSYLEEIGADEQTRRRIAALDKAGQPALADRTERVWNVTVELLDTFAKGGGQPRSLAAFSELFAAAATATELGTVPKGIDAVQIGGVDRSRLSEPRMVVLLGVNEGVFPAVPAFQGFLSERERELLHDLCALTLSKNKECVLTEEWLYAYTAVAAAREKVLLTYARGNLKGEGMLPSALVSEVERLLPNGERAVFRTDESWMPETPAEALSYFTATYRNATPLTAAVLSELSRIPAQKARLDALFRHAEKTPWHLENPASAKALFGDRLRLSATRIDRYYSCPFSYFCQNGLKVERRERATFDGREAGTFVHAVMETLLPCYVREYGDTHYAALTREQIGADIEELTAQYLDETMNGTPDKSARLRYQIARSRRVATEVMCHLIEEFKQSRFVPTDFELNVGANGDIPPLTLTLDDGSTVSFGGRIDRVDVYTQGDVTYLRVVDYKTGGKEFDLKTVVQGKNLQMLLYLYALCEEGSGRYKNPKPAGVLYVPGVLPQIDAADTEEKRETERRKKMKMNGFVLDDRELMEAMEPALEQAFIPVKLTKKGTLDTRSSKVLTEGQYEALQRLVKRKVTAMAEQLHAGRIEALPQTLDRDPCSTCAYADVCGREANDPVKEDTYFEGGVSGFMKAAEYIESKENGGFDETNAVLL